RPGSLIPRAGGALPVRLPAVTRGLRSGLRARRCRGTSAVPSSSGLVDDVRVGSLHRPVVPLGVAHGLLPRFRPRRGLPALLLFLLPRPLALLLAIDLLAHEVLLAERPEVVR